MTSKIHAISAILPVVTRQDGENRQGHGQADTEKRPEGTVDHVVRQRTRIKRWRPQQVIDLDRHNQRCHERP